MPTSSAPENVPARAKRRARTSTSGTASQQQQQQTAVLIEQAEAVRASLRDALSRTDQLIRGLKQHRKQDRIVQSALASLASLGQVHAIDS